MRLDGLYYIRISIAALWCRTLWVDTQYVPAAPAHIHRTSRGFGTVVALPLVADV